MKNPQEVSGSNDGCEVLSIKKGLKTYKRIKPSPKNKAGVSDNNQSELDTPQTISNKTVISDSGEEEILGDESNSQNQAKEKNVESGDNNSNQENSASDIVDITSDDEIYTLQCPQNYNKQDLCNANIDFTNLDELINSRGEVFKVQLLSSDEKFVTLAVPKNGSDGSLIKLPLKGHIVIQKCVNMADVEAIDEDAPDKDTVVFPDDIKVRHPLLGIDWETHAESACTAFTRASKKNKIQKKDRTKYVESSDVDDIDVKKIKRENEPEVTTRKRRKLAT